MARTAELKIRVEPDVKERAREVFDHWGISLSDAMNAFLIKSVEMGGFPFELRSSRYQRVWDNALRADAAGEHVVLPAEMDDNEDGLYDDLV